ncbi:hypothetical protein B7463_g11745, partial [Scytalidium lignicola]
MSNSVTISGVTLRNTVSVQQLALMPAVHVLILHAGRAFNGGYIQNDEAFIGQIRGVENVRMAFLVCLVVVVVIVIITLLALGAASGICITISKPLKLYSVNTLTPAPALALALSLSSPCCVVLALIGLVGSFQPDASLVVLALTLALTLALASPLLAERLHNLTETF